MSASEIRRFLDAQRTLVLTTLRKDGSPVAHALWFVRRGDALYVNTRQGSLKARNILADARVCALIDAGERYFELAGVRVEGRCRVVQDPALQVLVQAAQGEKDQRLGSGMEEMPAWFQASRSRRLERGARVILEIPMERVYSWDFAKLRDRYAPAAPPQETRP